MPHPRKVQTSDADEYAPQIARGAAVDEVSK